MRVEDARKNKKTKIRKRYIFRTIVLAVMLVAVVFALVTNFNKDKEIYKAGDKAPDFKLEQINENNEKETIQLSDLEGKGVMLNFWATYCGPCEAEMPFMESLYPEYSDDIEIVAVNLDASELVIHQFIRKYDLSFPVVHDTTSEVMDLYNVRPLPSTLFIDPEGYIVDRIEGALTLEKLEGHFETIQPK